MDYDLIIRNARIVDGTGNPWFPGDLAVDQGKIAAIGKLTNLTASVEIDAEGKILAPGFIDIHTHADTDACELSLMENYLRQGVTTLMGGNCGGSEYPIADHLAKMEQLPRTINYGLFVGHGTLRKEAMGMAMRPPTSAELAEMKVLAARAMDEGAFGISVGLYYAPGSFAQLDEIVEVTREIAQHGGLFTIHLRDESDYNIGLVESVKEAIAVAEQTGVSVQISHLKCLGKPVWGKAQEILALIEQARERGLDVRFDQYPYLASGTAITGAIIPRWAQEGGDAALTARLQDPATRAAVRVEMLANIERRGGPETLVVSRHKPDPSVEGKSLLQIGTERGMEPVDAAIELQIAGGAGLVSFNMRDEDLETIMRHPLGMVVSDGSLVAFGRGVPHPRWYGTFPRVLARYVREKKVISLEEAVRKMTSAPAHRVGLWDRGVIASGMIADLVLLDPETISDGSTFDHPHCYNQGVDLVMVAGEIALKKGQLTEARAGRLLRKNS
ncbi:MAG: N-acyl-D-amino-acid deacylase family protein [Bacillota bacterium]